MAERGGGLLASFDYLDAIVDAIHELRRAGFKELTAYSPYPEHHIEEALGYRESPVRVWTLVGGLTGAATGFAFTIWTSMDWPLVTGGKPILSVPAYVVIAFELTILFGALATLIGLFWNAGLPRFGKRAEVIYDAEFSSGRFGLHVAAPEDRTREARSILEKHEPALLVESPEVAHAG